MNTLEKAKEALTWLEEWFAQNIDDGGYHGCPWCYGHNDDAKGEPASWKDLKHSNDCLIGKALAELEVKKSNSTAQLNDANTVDIQSFVDAQLSKERKRAEELVKALSELLDGKRNGAFSVDVKMTATKCDNYDDDFADAVIYALSLWESCEKALAKYQEEGE